jgi:hypothetical protein
MLQLVSPIFMRTLLLSQIVEQLPQAGVFRPAGSLFVEAACFRLHRADLLPDDFEPQRLYQPDRLPVHETSDVVTADQGYVVAKLVPKEFDKAPPVAGFFAPHAVAYRR